jgi:tRNA (cmo5U34)-methyltransferase
MSSGTLGFGPGVWDSESYDRSRRRLVPSYDLLYGTAADVVARWGGDRPRVLDLGAGTGLLAAQLRAAVPGVRLTLLDGSAEMLRQATLRLGDAVDAVYVQDLRSPLPAGPFDAVVTALALHHLDDDSIRALFRELPGVLAPGGLFVNLEQILGPSAALDEVYADRHEQSARRAGSDDAEWASALQRMAHDVCKPLEQQMDWLRAAGFSPVDCLVKDWRFAVYAGWLPTSWGTSHS